MSIQTSCLFFFFCLVYLYFLPLFRVNSKSKEKKVLLYRLERWNKLKDEMKDTVLVWDEYDKLPPGCV